MSFPPRPPIMPGIMVPPFTYPPINMMPIGMMPVPGMMRPGLPMSTIPQMNLPRHQSFGKPEVIAPPVLNKPPEEKLPVTTVFVGNIHEGAPDAMIKSMLQKCGNVLSWKRVQGASGKLQGFGFCEYDNPASTLRCIRLLNDWNVVDKKLLVKVDAKTNDLLEEYKKKKDEKRKLAKVKEEGEDNSDDDGEDSEHKKDAETKEQLEAIMREHHSDLYKNADGSDESEKKTAKGKKSSEDMPPLNLEGMELEEDIKNLVNREIRSFRDAHLNSESGRDKEKDKERDRERDNRRRRDDDRARERELERERREREREREKERARERDKEREREREKIKSPPKMRDRSPVTDKRSRDREAFDVDEEEELYERKKLERKLREKEAAYQELLRKWESRERKKTREYERERQREKERRSEENKESKRLREFLEDYNDERDDVKYYKGSALQRRLHEREKEFEADERDRRREREELEEIRRKLQEQGHPDLESEMARIEREREGHLLPRIPIPGQATPDHSDSPVIVLDPENDNHADAHNNVISDSPRCFPSSYFYNSGNNNDDPEPMDVGTFSTLRSVNSAPKVPDTLDGHNPVNLVSPMDEETSRSPANNSDSNHTSGTRVDNSFGYFSDDSRGPLAQPTSDFGHGKSKINVELSNKSKTQQDGSPSQKSDKRKRSGVADIFNADEDEEVNNMAAKKRRLTLLDMNDDDKSSSLQSTGGASGASAPSTAEEKRKWIKNFIEKIPTKKKELFAWKVNWTLVDQDLVDKRIKPWINKKIVEYIGEDEPTLTEFICTKVHSHTPPDTILSDISMVLDEEAEVFVMKMWRLLIYEIEAKKHGVR